MPGVRRADWLLAAVAVLAVIGLVVIASRIARTDAILEDRDRALERTLDSLTEEHTAVETALTAPHNTRLYQRADSLIRARVSHRLLVYFPEGR